jgi:hypothetical protein
MGCRGDGLRVDNPSGRKNAAPEEGTLPRTARDLAGARENEEVAVVLEAEGTGWLVLLLLFGLWMLSGSRVGAAQMRS